MVTTEKIEYVNSSVVFDAIELGNCERQEFLDKCFTYGGMYSTHTLIKRCFFMVKLNSFIQDCEDIYEKEVMLKTLKSFNYKNLSEVEYFNIEA